MAVLSVQKCTELLPEDWGEVSALYFQQPECDKTPFNSPALMRLCAEVRGGTFFKVYERQQLIGILALRNAAFRCGCERVDGLVPLAFPCSDFTTPIVKVGHRQDFWKSFIGFLSSKMKSTPVLLEHLRNEDAEIVSGLCGPPVNTVLNPIRKNVDAPFEEVLQKKSLKRHRNGFARIAELSVTHVLSATEEDVREFARLHAERWAFEGQPSALSDADSFGYYARSVYKRSAHVDGLCVVLSTVKWRNEPIAMHLGYIWDSTFLYHLPAINVKYIDRSPGEVLMYELFKFAISANLQVFDFGVGDEGYKSRYSTSVQAYRSYIVNRPAKSTLHSVAGKLAAVFRRVASLRHLRRRMTRAAISETGSAVRFYSARKVRPCNVHELQEVQYTEYVDYVRTISRPPYALSRATFDRFRSGWRLFALHVKNRAVAFGWIYAGTSVFLSELGKSVHVESGAVWLLDFYTFEEDRCNGYYSCLLKHLVVRFGDEGPLIIYALTKNAGSLKGIEKAGFEYAASRSRIETGPMTIADAGPGINLTFV